MDFPIGYPRKVGFVSDAKINAYVAATHDAWKRGQYTGRLLSRLREMELVKFFGNKVYPDVPWTLSFLDDGHVGPVIADKFQKLCLAGQASHEQNVGGHVGLFEVGVANSVLVFSVMKCLANSDTAAWFRVEKELACSLLSTKLTGVFARDVVMPFPGFYVELPPGLLQLYAEDVGFCDLRTISISEGVSIEPSEYFMKFLRGAYVQPWKATCGRRISVLCMSDPSRYSVHFRDDIIRYFHVPLYDETLSLERISQNIAEGMIKSGVSPDDYNSPMSGKVLGSVVSDKEFGEVISSFVVNLLLYLSSRTSDVVSVKRAVPKRARNKKRNAVPTRKLVDVQLQNDFVVGSRVVIDPRVRQTMQASAAVGGISKAVNVLVRGHWRHVWHGKKTEESPKGEGRRPVWVQPFVRNKATGAVLGHQYEVR